MIKTLSIFFIFYELVKLLFASKESELRNSTVFIKNNDESTTELQNPLWQVYNFVNTIYLLFCIGLLLTFELKYITASVLLLLMSKVIQKEKSTPQLVAFDAAISIIILSTIIF